jgi:hypothetical protein
MTGKAQQTAPAAPTTDHELDPLEELLASVNRIEVGVGGIYELAVGIGERPAPPTPPRLRRDDYPVIDNLRRQIGAAHVEGSQLVTVPVAELARILVILDRVQGAQ